MSSSSIRFCFQLVCFFCFCFPVAGPRKRSIGHLIWAPPSSPDPTSSSRAVRQYKTPLLQRLERENNDPTLNGRLNQSDTKALQSFYQLYYKKYIQALQKVAGKADRSASSSFILLLYDSPIRRSIYIYIYIYINNHKIITEPIDQCIPRVRLTKAYQTAAVLFEVLNKAISVSWNIKADQQASLPPFLLEYQFFSRLTTFVENVCET
jgi:hypothetical protein